MNKGNCLGTGPSFNILRQFALFHYAARHWGDHARGETELVIALLENKANAFFFLLTGDVNFPREENCGEMRFCVCVGKGRGGTDNRGEEGRSDVWTVWGCAKGKEEGDIGFGSEDGMGKVRWGI